MFFDQLPDKGKTMSTRTRFNADGIGVKESYTKIINGNNETVVVIVYRNFPRREHHFYRPGGEKSASRVVKVPNFFNPRLPHDITEKGRTCACKWLQESTPEQVTAQAPEKKSVVLTFRRPWKIAGADRATAIFE